MPMSESKTLVQRLLLSVPGRLIVSLILCLLYPVVLIAVVLPCILYRLLNRLAARILRPDLDGITDVGSQALISNQSLGSRNGINIMNMNTVKGKLSVESVTKIFETQVLPLKEYKPLKAYPVRFGGYFYWKPDLVFNIKNHIRVYDGEVDHGNSSVVTNEDLKRIMGDLLGCPWKRNQSLWEVLVLNNYYCSFSNDGGDETGDKSALIIRAHHVMMDGYSLSALIKRIFTGDSSASVTSGYKGRSWTRRIAELLAGPYFLWGYASVIGRRDYGFKITKDGRGEGSSYMMTWTEAISVEEVSGVKRKLGVSFQAAINAIISGATSKLLKELGHEPPRYIVVGQAWYVPGHPGGLSNHAAPAAVALPVGEKDPIRRVQLSQKELSAAMGAVSPELILSQTNLFLHCCPLGKFLKPPKGIRKAPLDIVLTGCPGPRGPVFIDGQEVELFCPSVGLMHYLGDATVILCTALGKLTFTFVARKHFCSDPKLMEMFNIFLLEEMQALLNAKPLDVSTVIEA